MSDRAFRISRRKLLQLSSVAPFVALMARADGPSPMTPVKGKLPGAAADALLLKAQGHKPQVPPGLFKDVATILWEFFEAGAEARGDEVPNDDTIKQRLALIAYDQPNRGSVPSGHLIVDSIMDFGDRPSPGKELLKSATLGCAYLCGYYVTEAAIFAGVTLGKNPAPGPGQKDLDVELYAIGYKRTEQQMVKTLDRLGGDSKGPAKILAAGCG